MESDSIPLYSSHGLSVFPFVDPPNKASMGQKRVIPSATFIADRRAIQKGKERYGRFAMREVLQAKPNRPQVIRINASMVPMFFCKVVSSFLCIRMTRFSFLHT